MKDPYPLGIAKDGRIIWGPFGFLNSPWKQTDVDVCNGAEI